MAKIAAVAIAAFLFLILPVAAARGGQRQAVVASLMIMLAGMFLLFAVASHRLVWDSIPYKASDSPEQLAEGARLQKNAMLPFVWAMLGPILGLSILVLVPPKGELRVREDDAA
ncbi:MAG: hypothetical protein R3F35_11635 [Myxococcota bacterium]